MANRELDISRRKVLAGLGTIGLASAGAGAGTSAFLNDPESFEDNTLTAGELDLKVDWEEHYYRGDVSGARPVDDPTAIGDDEIGLPDTENPLVAVADSDLESFMDGTAIEAYPDNDNDGIQDDLEQYDECVDFADTSEDMDPTGGTGLRTDNDDTADVDGNAAPLVNLHDVKPGDFGELTLSFHLCDNPGYVWLQGEPVSAAENGVTEPEGDSANETGNATESVTGDAVTSSDVELLDEIQTLVWYDEDGDNVYEPGGSGGEEVDVMLVLDDSGSMGGQKLTNAKSAAKNLVNSLNLGSNAGQVGLVRFDSGVSMPQGLTTDASAVTGAIDNLSAGGSTNIEGAVDAGREELTSSDVSNDISFSGNARSSAQKVMVVLSDGAPNVDEDGDGSTDPRDEATDAKNDGIEMFTVGFGNISGSTEDILRGMASDPKSGHFFTATVDEIEEVFAQISQAVSGEECFFRGSLRELLTAVSSGNGIPLDGDRATPFEETEGAATADARDCFVNSTNNFLGVAWYLPRSVENQIQGDSVSFDLGFYVEQCRHNDGSGPSTA